VEISTLKLFDSEGRLASRVRLFSCESTIVVPEKFSIIDRVVCFSAKLTGKIVSHWLLYLHFFLERAVVRLIVLLHSSSHVHLHHDLLLIVSFLDIDLHAILVVPSWKHHLS
jgi:hypothetical protein